MLNADVVITVIVLARYAPRDYGISRRLVHLS